MRKIIYISGSRADFGLMKSTLSLIHKEKSLSLKIVATGTHLLERYGKTISDIEDEGLEIINKVHVSLSGSSGYEMAIAVSDQIKNFSDILQSARPDLVLLLGDRGEMLAAAIAAVHLGIPIVHIHGGEISGTIDESFRHAITKLSHYHFCSTEAAANRLRNMGEKNDYIFVVGAPGIDEIKTIEPISRKELLNKFNIDAIKPFFLMLYHPVHQESEDSDKQIEIIMNGLLKFNTQIIALAPNSDSGGKLILSSLDKYKEQKKIHLITHLKRSEYLSLLSEAEVFIGNSSSGIIESASTGTPFVNIGSRQSYRERSNNTIDARLNSKEIYESVIVAKNMNKQSFKNIYGMGDSGKKIVNLLKKIKINKNILYKINAY